MDDEGIRGQVVESKRLKLDFSVAGQVPVNADGDNPRSDMPDLEPTGEIGPSLDYILWRHQHSQKTIWLRFPVRFVFSVGEPWIAYRGWKFSPYIDFVQRFPTLGNMRLSFAVGPVISNNQYHDYFYQVQRKYITPLRGEYEASSGYSGSRATLTATTNLGDFWVGGIIRYDNLSDAAFEGSPLVSSRQYWVFGITVAWIFKQSETLVVD